MGGGRDVLSDTKSGGGGGGGGVIPYNQTSAWDGPQQFCNVSVSVSIPYCVVTCR